MSNYIGVRCPVCNKKFTSSDDIVVCPICGAPHHRACYAEKNSCAFVSDHLSGKEWHAPAPDPVSPDSDSSNPNVKARSASYAGENGSEDVVCAKCHSKNPKDTIFCQSCGTRMSFNSSSPFSNPYMNIDPSTMVYGGLSPEEKINDEAARDLALYVGINSAYFLPRFKKMFSSQKFFDSLSFNFSALVFSCFYFFYRKMYMVGGVLLAIFVIGAIPSFLHAREVLPQVMFEYFGIESSIPVNQAQVAYYQQLINIINPINLAFRFAIAFLANRFYCIKAISDVKQIRESQSEKHDEITYCAALRDKGGVDKTAVTVVLCTCFVVYFVSACIMSYEYLVLGGFIS